MSPRDHTPPSPTAGGGLAPDPGGADPAAGAEAGLELSHAAMNTAYREGLSTPFSLTVPWIMRYLASWWVLYERGWLRITDELTASDLDRLAAQMGQADALAARDNAIRNAVASAPPPGREPPVARPSP